MNHLKSVKILILLLVFCAVSALAQERRAIPPSDSAPEDWTRIPFQDWRPEFVPTDAEKAQGFALFTRPLVDAVYPESRPGADERFEKLAFFAAGDQFQTLNFAVYPLQDLKGLRVNAGKFSLQNDPAAVFPAENIQIRLVTYRDIRYPQYSSKTMQYRVLPEYMQDVTVTDAPALEPQRYFITFKVPKGTKPGVYAGNVTVSVDDSGKSVNVPVELKVLGFDLLKDPKKHYGAYYYAPLQADGRTWDKEAMEREFAVMRDYGFTRSPVYVVKYTDNEDDPFVFPELDFWLGLMKKNGMEGPIPVIGGSPTWIASKFGGKFGKHIQIEQMPSPDFWPYLAGLCKKLKEKVDALPEGTPKMVFGPLDEISSESSEFGTGVYKAFHDAGLTTYTTMEPMNRSFPEYDSCVDIFASQVYLPLYDEIQKRHKQEYWCYPNHNSYERKDMVIMCKGGRMTYGFGMWRSGFDFLLPWIWRNRNPDHFNLNSSGGANIFNPETGEMIMGTYWECFREGIYDLRYLYTLENAVVQREGSQNGKLNAEIKKSRDLLQEIWDSIIVKEKYLNRDLWDSPRFDAYRERIANQIVALYEYPPVNPNAVAPSVIIEPRVIPYVDPFQAACEKAEAEGTMKTASIKPEHCARSEEEAEVKVVEGADRPAGAQSDKLALLTITIDKTHDGSSGNGLYPSGWPALGGYLTENVWKDLEAENGGQPITVKGMRLRLFIESNRTKNPDKTPIHVGIQPGSYAFNCPAELKQGEWHTIYVPLENAGYEGMPKEGGIPRSVRLTITESNHEDGDVIKIYFDDISFIWSL